MTLPAAQEDVPATIRAMLGPPALLPGEDAAIYEATLAHFAREVAPRDIIAWMLIKDLADHRLEIARYRRIRTALVRYPFDQSRRRRWRQEARRETTSKSCLRSTKPSMSSAKRSRRAAGRTSRRSTSRSTPMPPISATRRDQSWNAMIAEIRSYQPTDRDIAASLPSWIGGYQQLDRCLQAAEERFIATLRDIERHVAGFGKTLRRVDVIEGEVLCEAGRRDGAGRSPTGPMPRAAPGRARVAARRAPAATRCVTASPRCASRMTARKRRASPA